MEKEDDVHLLHISLVGQSIPIYIYIYMCVCVCVICLWASSERSESSYLLTTLQFVLHFSSFQISHPLRVASFVLCRWWWITMRPRLYVNILFNFFVDFSSLFTQPKRRIIDKSRDGPFQLLKSDVSYWPSNERCCLRLTSSSTDINHTAQTLYFFTRDLI